MGFILQTLKQKTHEKNITLLYATALTGCIPLCAQRTASVSLDPETGSKK